MRHHSGSEGALPRSAGQVQQVPTLSPHLAGRRAQAHFALPNPYESRLRKHEPWLTWPSRSPGPLPSPRARGAWERPPFLRPGAARRACEPAALALRSGAPERPNTMANSEFWGKWDSFQHVGAWEDVVAGERAPPLTLLCRCAGGCLQKDNKVIFKKIKKLSF